jgi:carotenoid cleavage dioxygenase
MVMSLEIIMAGADIFWGLILGMIWYRIKAAFYRLKSVGNGNTALAFFGSRLLALQEAGKPVETSVPSLNTTGEYYFEEENVKESEKNTKKGPKEEVCTAHPKVRDLLQETSNHKVYGHMY